MFFLNTNPKTRYAYVAIVTGIAIFVVAASSWHMIWLQRFYPASQVYAHSTSYVSGSEICFDIGYKVSIEDHLYYCPGVDYRIRNGCLDLYFVRSSINYDQVDTMVPLTSLDPKIPAGRIGRLRIQVPKSRNIEAIFINGKKRVNDSRIVPNSSW